ncbi:epidermal growth factor receptor substrate 15-like 1 isoform X3 [Venturia canescens]|uniref:epidermal growth factor receptor substrate 15-like 1 isoform X3 n=1 Tax=Venturia canescens TaxID=32260 RepID=UPI001C9D2E12|nr:epidermal growth factor receptor substrate 15-like 1 isoform X3 [Venturia canescens]
MAALPSPTQVAGSHIAIYEAYYNQVDPQGYGQVGALAAARFLKKSQLSDIVLSRIWDMSDPQSRGFLDKSGMFVALKLCAFAQAGRELNIANLSQDTPPPKMGELPKIVPKPPVAGPPVITSVSSGDWSIKPNERAKYDQLFDSLQPSNGYIPGNKVKGVLMDSKLPVDTLGKIWDLADMDKDGMLDRHEFVVAMHLVYKALEKYAIPSVLPPELMPPGKRKPAPPIMEQTAGVQILPMATPPPPIPPLPNATLATSNLVGLEPVKTTPIAPKWVVTLEDQAAADKLFLQADMDMDGFVSGSEIKDVFLQSRLPQSVLANIWSLCDICQSGKLNKEQFALSMWLIKQTMKGIDPPTSLTPEMVPPSLRKISDTVVENNNITGYSNPELDMISKDIAELARERRAMEQDIAQKEADIKIKSGEIKSLQSELDTLAATLKQLENQRGEAQKRLNDLKAQRADVDRELTEIEKETRGEQDKVDKLRQQAEEQESVLRTQEDELNSKRQELEGLRQEEQQLEKQQNQSREQLNELTKNLQNTQLQISQAKVKITHLEEQQRQMSDAIAIYDSALAAGDPSLVPDTSLNFNPEIEDIGQEEQNSKTNNSVGDAGDGFSNGTIANSGFSMQDGDPFASSKAKEAFGTSNDTDPFASAFDAKPSNIAMKDPFGEDPFANLHAPTRAESPSPALPPKKAKQPPPRPAPPRPASAPGGPGGPLRAAPAPPTPSPTPDPFGNANSDPFAAQMPSMDSANGNTFMTGSTTGFADFANFDSKPELLPCRSSSVPPRPVTGRPRVATSSIPTPTSKLPDFTEDPFRDYRYEDPFNIADPFAEDAFATDDTINANMKSNAPRQLDPFGMETPNSRRESNDSFTRGGFESDFTSSTVPRNHKVNEVANAYGDANSNVKYERDFSDVFATKKSTKTINIDEAFSVKTEKTSKKTGLDVSEDFKNKLSLGEKKNQTNAWKNSGGGGGSYAMSKIEERQLAWASKQSLKAEDERRKLKEQEEADFAFALELSKQDKNGKF